MSNEILNLQSAKAEIEERLKKIENLNGEQQLVIERLEHQNTTLLGHQNPKQKIQYLTAIKQENMNLKRQLKELQSEIAKKKETKLHQSMSRNSSSSSLNTNANTLSQASLASLSMSPVLVDKENLFS